MNSPKTLSELIDEAVSQESGLKSVASDLVKEAVKEIVAGRRANAVATVRKMIISHSDLLKMHVGHLKEIREQEKEQTALVKRIDRAFRYFQATGIPFPLFLAENPSARLSDVATNIFCKELRLAVPDKDSDLWTIPADFKS